MPLFKKDTQNKDDIESPIEFYKDKNHTESPISFMNEEINSRYQFAILKTTENGKWVRGNMLFYSMNGVEVYTDLNNIIFVDEANNTLFVREYNKALNEIAPENPEQRQYVILYTEITNEDDEEISSFWISVTGRMNAYEAIKQYAYTMDLDKSIVLTDSVPIKDALTVKEFIKYLQNANFVDEDDDFDINQFE